MGSVQVLKTRVPRTVCGARLLYISHAHLCKWGTANRHLPALQTLIGKTSATSYYANRFTTYVFENIGLGMITQFYNKITNNT